MTDQHHGPTQDCLSCLHCVQLSHNNHGNISSINVCRIKNEAKSNINRIQYVLFIILIINESRLGIVFVISLRSAVCSHLADFNIDGRVSGRDVAFVCQRQAGCVSHHGQDTLSTTFITLKLKSKYRFSTGAIKGQQCPERAAVVDVDGCLWLTHVH